MRHPQTLGQQQLQFVAEPLSPMAQVGAFVRELVLEKLKLYSCKLKKNKYLIVMLFSKASGFAD